MEFEKKLEATILGTYQLIFAIFFCKVSTQHYLCAFMRVLAKRYDVECYSPGNESETAIILQKQKNNM